ncbi:hypothetical protein K227x_07110 [Rubripirellula lacrimiformis]|uniref:3-keto-disaccharide hydrolase domain-containing protein n=1 Tax=Rubripirellula lacrimiformis TaxID=1930273 RepID=A0A517N5D2_9BACT|nr:hypothetical protein [Rubripirellula lacrimiformis]QDT02335.1 hypothetical protein K227x_07110 [Rubripirellula lacrimiformis]
MIYEASMIRFVLVMCLFWMVTDRSLAEDPRIESTMFQGQSWTGVNLHGIKRTTHRGHPSLQIVSGQPDSIATINGVHFQSGTIEMDISAMSHSQPTLALFVDESRMHFDRVVFSPWPVFADEPLRRLRQGIVTTVEHQSVVVNFHHGNAVDWERERLFHIRLEVEAGICRIFIDDDAEPVFLFANSERAKSGGLIGIAASSCFIRNVQILPLDHHSATIPSRKNSLDQSSAHSFKHESSGNLFRHLLIHRITADQ